MNLIIELVLIITTYIINYPNSFINHGKYNYTNYDSTVDN